MAQTSKKQHSEDDDVSLKDLILKSKEYFFYLLSKWYVIFLFVILSVLYQIYNIVTHNISYEAPLTFMVNEDESSSLGGVGSLLGSFGGLLGAGSEYNLDKILELSKSNRIGKEILFNKLTINDREDFIVNHLIETLDTLDDWNHIKWYKRPLTDMVTTGLIKDFRFRVDTLNYSDPIQATVTKKVFGKLFGNKDAGLDGMVTSDFDELTGIMTIKSSTPNEVLSIALTNNIYETLKKFYIDKSIEKQQQTFDIMKAKHDSIENIFNRVNYSLASFEDNNRGLFRSSDKVKRVQLEQNRLIHATALAEAKKNLEIADFALKDKTPFIHAIDEPFSPLKNSKPNLINSLIFGGILGVFLSVLMLLSQKIYGEIME